MNNDSQYFNTQNSGYNSIPQYNNVTPQKSKKGFGKYIVIALILVAVAVGVYFLITNLGGTKKLEENLDAVFDPNKPIVVENNGKYGYITSEGKIMIEPKYNSANDFHGDYAMVEVDNPDTTSWNKEIYQIIDKQGNVKLVTESYYNTGYYPTYDVWVVDNVLYDSKLNPVLSEGITVEYIDEGYFEYSNSQLDESGIIDYTGKKYFTWAGDYIYADISSNDTNPDDLYARATISEERDLIVSLKTGKIVYQVEDASENHLYVEYDNIFKEYNSDYECVKTLFFIDGKLAYETTEKVSDLEMYDYENQILEIDYGYNYDNLGKEQRRYYYDIKNDKILTEKPSLNISESDLQIDLFEELYGYKKFNSSSKYGLMSGDKVVVPAEYSDIEFLNGNLHKYMKSKGQELVLLEKDNQTILMNLKNQKVMATFDSRYVSSSSDSTFLKATLYEENGYITKGYIIYNVLSGKSITIGKDDSHSINSNYITITKDNKRTYYNTDLKEIYVKDV